MKRRWFSEVWRSLLGMAIFLSFAIRAYLLNDRLAFWGHLGVFIWFLLGLGAYFVENRRGARAFHRIRLGFLVCFVAFEGYQLLRAFSWIQ